MIEALNDPVAVVAGLALPYLLAIVKQNRTRDRAMAIISVLASLGLGYAVAQRGGQINQEDLLSTAGVILAISQGFYHTIGKEFGLPELDLMTRIGGVSPDAIPSQMPASSGTVLAELLPQDGTGERPEGTLAHDGDGSAPPMDLDSYLTVGPVVSARRGQHAADPYADRAPSAPLPIPDTMPTTALPVFDDLPPRPQELPTLGSPVQYHAAEPEPMPWVTMPGDPADETRPF